MSYPPGWGRQLFPPAGDVWGPAHGHPLLPPPVAVAERGRAYLVLNMVVTVDGRTTVHGTAAHMGSPTDQVLMGRLRAEADVLLHGAETVRVDKVVPRVPGSLVAERRARGQPPQPAGAVVSRSGWLQPQQAYFRTATEAWPRYVYTERAPVEPLEHPGVHLRLLAEGELSMRRVLEDLWQQGLRRIVCEGGPHLNAALFQEELVDELFVTLAPRLGGGTNPLPLMASGGAPARNLLLRSAYEREGELLLRYAVDTPS